MGGEIERAGAEVEWFKMIEIARATVALGALLHEIPRHAAMMACGCSMDEISLQLSSQTETAKGLENPILTERSY